MEIALLVVIITLLMVGIYMMQGFSEGLEAYRKSALNLASAATQTASSAKRAHEENVRQLHALKEAMQQLVDAAEGTERQLREMMESAQEVDDGIALPMDLGPMLMAMNEKHPHLGPTAGLMVPQKIMDKERTSNIIVCGGRPGRDDD